MYLRTLDFKKFKSAWHPSAYQVGYADGQANKTEVKVMRSTKSQLKYHEVDRILRKNNFVLDRTSGSHMIYTRSGENHGNIVISRCHTVNAMIWRRKLLAA